MYPVSGGRCPARCPMQPVRNSIVRLVRSSTFVKHVLPLPMRDIRQYFQHVPIADFPIDRFPMIGRVFPRTNYRCRGYSLRHSYVPVQDV